MHWTRPSREARLASRLRQPARVYALAELLIGATGLFLVLLFPVLPGLLAPLLQKTLESPALLNSVRLVSAFVLMLVPCTAMGATLPILVKVLLSNDPDYGRVLGLLYGWNTIGAVAGALACELILVPLLSVRFAGVTAAALNLVAAAIALSIWWT